MKKQEEKFILKKSDIVPVIYNNTNWSITAKTFEAGIYGIDLNTGLEYKNGTIYIRPNIFVAYKDMKEGLRNTIAKIFIQVFLKYENTTVETNEIKYPKVLYSYARHLFPDNILDYINRHIGKYADEYNAFPYDFNCIYDEDNF